MRSIVWCLPLVAIVIGCTRQVSGELDSSVRVDTGSAIDAGNDTFAPPGTDSGIDAGADAFSASGDGGVDAFVPPGTDAGVDARTPTYTVVGTIGSVGSVPSGTIGFSVVNDGFETGGLVCSAGSPVYCIYGGLVP